MIISVTQTDSNLVVNLAVPGSGSSLALPNSWLRAQRAVPVGLADSPTQTIDLSLSNNFSLVLGGNRTLANPTGLLPGQAGQIVVTQGDPGGWVLTYGAVWKFRLGIPPVLSTTPGAMDILSYYVVDTSRIAISAGLGFA